MQDLAREKKRAARVENQTYKVGEKGMAGEGYYGEEVVEDRNGGVRVRGV